MKFRFIPAAILVAALFGLCGPAGAGESLSTSAIRARISSEIQRPGWQDRAIPGQLIVRFRATASAAARSRALAAAGPKTKTVAKNPLTGSHFVAVDPSVSLEKAIGNLDADPSVAWAEPVWTKHLATVPNDPRFTAQWALRNTGQAGYGPPTELDTSPGTAGSDIAATDAWSLATQANPVIIAFIDTGVDLNHPDLKANLWTNPGEIPGNGKDDDGNGYVDDIHGYDFAASRDSNGTLHTDADPSDIDGHGTATAGCALAAGNNGIGISGVAWAGKIMVLKVEDPTGNIGTDSILLATAYAAKNGAKIINASYEGYTYDQEEHDSIQALVSKGILMVAAAGNDNLDMNRVGNEVYPADYNLPNILTVTSTQRNDLLSWFSNYGGEYVAVAAPGEGILTTLPNYDPDPSNTQLTYDAAYPIYDDDHNGFHEYGGLSGTSFSTPIVSGAAAMLLALHPGYTPAQVRDRVIGAADPLPSLSQAATVGGGRLNLHTLLDFSTPHVAFMSPAVLIPGETTQATLHGVNFTSSSTVSFSGTGITASVDPTESTETALVLNLTVAPLESQTAQTVDVTVHNPNGKSTTQPEIGRVEGHGYVYSDFTPQAIPDATAQGPGQPVIQTIQVSDPITVADIDLHLKIQHPWVGDLQVILKGPDGTQWTVLNQQGYYGGSFGQDSSQDIDSWYPSESFPEKQPIPPFAGKSAQGTWTLQVTDLAQQDTGTLLGWELRLVGEQEWTFASSPPVFVVPVAKTGPDYISLRSADAVNCFGFWHSQPNLTIPAGSLARVGYTVSTDVTTSDEVPLYRLRLNSDDSQLALLTIMQRNGAGPQTPTVSGTQATWFTAPPTATLGVQTQEPRYETAFDLLNFDPRIAPNGELVLQNLTIDQIPLSSLADQRSERTYSFATGADGWFQGTSSVYTAPQFSSSSGKLTMTATNSTSTFGIWTSPADVVLDSSRIYRLRFTVAASSALANVPSFRLRVGDSDQLQGVALVVNSRGDGAFETGPAGKEYDVYFAPPPGLPAGDALQAAIDMMNFDPSDDPAGVLSLLSLQVDSFARPE